MQSRVATGHPIVCNMLKTNWYLLGLADSPSGSKCVAEKETSVYVLS
jgi:hypothetical protein